MSYTYAPSSSTGKKALLLITSLAVVLSLIIFFAGNFSFGEKVVSADGNPIQAVVYKSPTCGCCGNYVAYLKRREFEVDVVDTQDMASIKAQQKIPAELTSCHTTIIGQYVVEGHIPVEAISKLLLEKPDIAGIALAGMPSGSPGMPGVKEPFEIHAITKTGEDGGIFMEL